MHPNSAAREGQKPMKTKTSIASQVFDHLSGDGLINDIETTDFYREYHGLDEDAETDLEEVEEWAQATFYREKRRREAVTA
jgi:hypothetical protein